MLGYGGRSSLGIKPKWLKTHLPGGKDYSLVIRTLRELNLHTVCEESRCPNLGKCFGRRTATIMILGKVCTRHCHFCSVRPGNPERVDEKEPEKVAQAIKKLGLKYVVITSVTRDDLEDGGAGQFAETIKAIKRVDAECRVEVLIPDFKGIEERIEKVISANPEVIGHNIETTRALTPVIRDKRASYDLSLTVLRYINQRAPGIIKKSGLMVGLGETEREVISALEDLRECDVDIVTIGQYLPPTRFNPPVKKFYNEAEFNSLTKIGKAIGFKEILAGPLVRSSYQAEEIFKAIINSKSH